MSTLVFAAPAVSMRSEARPSSVATDSLLNSVSGSAASCSSTLADVCLATTGVSCRWRGDEAVVASCSNGPLSGTTSVFFSSSSAAAFYDDFSANLASSLALALSAIAFFFSASWSAMYFMMASYWVFLRSSLATSTSSSSWAWVAPDSTCSSPLSI